MDKILLSDFLEIDSIIKTSVKNGEWISNIVSDISPDMQEIEIPFNEKYLGSLTMVGDDMQLTQTIDGYEYITDTIITQITIEPKKCMRLRVKDIKKVENRRRDERYSVNYAVTIQSITEYDGVFGVVVNISVSGLAFVCRKEFMHGETVNLSIMLPSSVFTIAAEVMRISETSKGMEYGVKFIRTDDEAVKEINALIDDIKEREDRLSRIVGFNMA